MMFNHRDYILSNFLGVSVVKMNPAEDIFDVVNEHDADIIDQQPRSLVHSQGLRHRAAHVLVFNKAGQVFLQLRSQSKDNHPGVWDNSCSGHVDAGEKPARWPPNVS